MIGGSSQFEFTLRNFPSRMVKIFFIPVRGNVYMGILSDSIRIIVRSNVITGITRPNVPDDAPDLEMKST